MDLVLPAGFETSCPSPLVAVANVRGSLSLTLPLFRALMLLVKQFSSLGEWDVCGTELDPGVSLAELP
jgi:hypothetical protein